MNEPETISELAAPALATVPNCTPWSAARVGLGVICGAALIVSIMPICSCSGRTREMKAEQRHAAIEEAIRQQTVQMPAPGHGRTVTANQ
ncbi:MAG: hypothetical protein ACPGVU_13020 [Limisphaerales bacterium]